MMVELTIAEIGTLRILETELRLAHAMLRDPRDLLGANQRVVPMEGRNWKRMNKEL